MQQRQASAHTIASYRDTFRLLLQFAQKRLRRAPSTLALEDIDAPLVVDFLDEQEKVRDVTARTRNLRLTAIHSFFHYVAFEAPAHAAQIQRVLAIPAKRFARALVAVSESTRSRCATRGAGSAHMVRAPRSRPHSARGADRATSVGVDRPSAAGSASGDRRARARDRQGTQGTMYAAEQEHSGRPRCLGERTTQAPGSALVPERKRRSFERARRALPVGQARRRGNHRLPIAEAPSA